MTAREASLPTVWAMIGAVAKAAAPRNSSSIGVGRFSFSMRSAPSFLYDADDAEGDIGYATARTKEKHTRKVIVERLETVKSSNPVFTWC